MNHRYTRIVLTVLTASSLFACATSTPRPETSLYERLGGKPAIEAVVNDFIDRVGQDARITHLPRPERVPVLKARLTDLVCQATGGPCAYGGRDMKTAHAGMGITGDEFEAVVDDLVETLNKYEVPQPEQSEILALLAPMRPDIVEARH